MHQKKSRQCCALMLIVSVCLRICMVLGLDARLKQLLVKTVVSPQAAMFLLQLETGQTAVIEKKKPQVVVFTVEHSEPSVKTAEASELQVAGQCTYGYDKQALLSEPSQLDFSVDGPTILIIHSHSTEAYCAADGLSYEAVSDSRTLDPARNVIAVGEVLAKSLESAGLQVIHDTSIYDYPDYNSSYYNSLQSIRRHLAENPSIQMVIDVHRDAVENDQGQAVALLSEQNGMPSAQLMLVVGTDEGGLEHPDWQKNLANALKLQAVLVGEYPGLCRKLDLRTERFNQHATPGSILVEVGTNGNTLTQAMHSARLLADAIVKTITLMKNNP